MIYTLNLLTNLEHTMKNVHNAFQFGQEIMQESHLIMKHAPHVDMKNYTLYIIFNLSV